MISEYKKVKEKLLTNLDKNCQHFFVKNAYILESAYSYLLDDKLDEAEKNFQLIKNQDIRASWALCLIGLIRGNLREYPTYFQIRNFLEIDLNILIYYYKGNYAENIIRYCDFLFTINPEVYKFIGRVLYNNDLLEQAMYFLQKAKNYFWNDPELHYLLGYIYYYNNKDIENAQKALQDCLTVLPKYFPAVDLLSKIAKK